MTGINRRGLLKGSIFGMAAAGASVIPVAVQAQAAAPVKTEEYDVVVIGCGCAGMAAALEAADKGAKVVILEKMSRPAGNTIFAGGHFNATNTYVQKAQGLQDTIDDFYRDMMIVSQQRGDKALTRQYCEMSGSAIQWLTDECGVKFKPIVVEVFPGLNRGHVVDGKLKPGGAQLSKQMFDTVKAKKIPVLFNTKVISLIGDNRLHVLGCRAVNEDDEAVDFMAKGGVVICTGGFHANKEMVCRYMGGDVAWMPIRGSNVLQGENITLTMPFNPKYVNMDQFHAGPIIGATHVNPADVLNSGYGIQVNTSGDRYMDENNTYVIKARTTAQKTLDNTGWVIVDSTCPVLDKVIPKFDMLNSPYGKANTIEEVAKQAGLPPAKIVALVKEYNDAVKNGTLGKMNPPNTYKKPHLIEKSSVLCCASAGRYDRYIRRPAD